MKKSAKILCAVLALVLALGCGVGGTLAYLAAKTSDVVNTFTFGDLSVKLTESERTYNIVPGTNIPKDPKAAVIPEGDAGKVPAWLFVEVKEENWPTPLKGEGSDRKVDYKFADGWTELSGSHGEGVKVIYRAVSESEYSTEFSILANDQVTVDGSLTKAEVDTAKTVTPKLTFTAYAVQQANLTVEQAWAVRDTAKPVA